MPFGRGSNAFNLNISRISTAPVLSMFLRPPAIIPRVPKELLHVCSPAVFLLCCLDGGTLLCSDLVVLVASLVHDFHCLQFGFIAGQAVTSRAAAPLATLICFLLSGALKTCSPVEVAVPVDFQSALRPQLDGQQVAGDCTFSFCILLVVDTPDKEIQKGRDSRQ